MIGSSKRTSKGAALEVSIACLQLRSAFMLMSQQTCKIPFIAGPGKHLMPADWYNTADFVTLWLCLCLCRHSRADFEPGTACTARAAGSACTAGTQNAAAVASEPSTVPAVVCQLGRRRVSASKRHCHCRCSISEIRAAGSWQLFFFTYGSGC